jgi:hypothetical protein
MTTIIRFIWELVNVPSRYVVITAVLNLVPMLGHCQTDIWVEVIDIKKIYKNNFCGVDILTSCIKGELVSRTHEGFTVTWKHKNGQSGHFFSKNHPGYRISINDIPNLHNSPQDSIVQRDRMELNDELRTPEQQSQSRTLALRATISKPDTNGAVVIEISTNTSTISLKVNGEEQGGRPDGKYTINKVARVGQDTNYVITAIDSNGNTDSTNITVARQTVSSSLNQSVSLKPENIKRATSRDAVAIIIGIQNYKRVPKADFANNDAKEFYEYAIRGLGIRPENIKLLVDEEAEQIELYKVFQNWLPLQVTKNKTNVYVFYSGHGLPSPDGKSLYLLPQGVDKQFIEKTALSMQEVISALVASKPKSVTMFIDACYSGQTRGGETLLASAKPIALKTDTNAFPSNFTVISASANDQISSSSPELKHGIFSFYLMKGMEGEADGNKDGKITAGEMQEYLQDKVSRQAMSMSRKQDTQLVGDANRVLIGR